MQLQNPATNFNQNHKNVQNNGGFHSPNYREPISPLESDSSSFHFSSEEYFGMGTTYGNYKYGQGFSANPDYADDSLYGPGFDNPLSSFYGFRPKI